MTKKLASFISETEKNGYFLTENDIDDLEQVDCFTLVLVRTQCGRFLCPCQHVKTYISLLEKAGDYVRDVSFTADQVDEARKFKVIF